MDFDETDIALVYVVGGYWIITYVKKKGNTSVYNHDKAYFSVLFGSEYNGYHKGRGQ